MEPHDQRGLELAGAVLVAFGPSPQLVVLEWVNEAVCLLEVALFLRVRRGRQAANDVACRRKLADDLVRLRRAQQLSP